jgi:endonuclease/exonuclease/phosphatase family metal-dependent hydrolase
MKFLFVWMQLFIWSSASLFSQDSLRILTWNIQNMGQSKDDVKLEFIADICRHYDLIAIQEVSVGPAGARAVAFLADKLNRRGAAWDYRVSDPTDGPGSERYAYLWKKNKVKAYGSCFLEQKLADSINREPYLCRFIAGKDTLLLANFHAVPTQKGPARENGFLYLMTYFYPGEKLLFMGDFNLGQKNPAFMRLKDRGWQPALTGHKTSLRMEVRDGNHLASEYDHIFYPATLLKKLSAGVDDFSRKFPTLTEARGISDHLPIWLTIQTSR